MTRDTNRVQLHTDDLFELHNLGYSLKEIAERYGYTVVAVERRYYRKVTRKPGNTNTTQERRTA